jgi:hypothetical protein
MSATPISDYVSQMMEKYYRDNEIPEVQPSEYTHWYRRPKLVGPPKPKPRKSIEEERALRRIAAGLPIPTRPEPRNCECCGASPKAEHHGLHLDHDHQTGAFRGWLCGRCNSAIGLLGDTIEGVDRAIVYLRSHGRS